MAARPLFLGKIYSRREEKKEEKNQKTTVFAEGLAKTVRPSPNKPAQGFSIEG